MSFGVDNFSPLSIMNSPSTMSIKKKYLYGEKTHTIANTVKHDVFGKEIVYPYKIMNGTNCRKNNNSNSIEKTIILVPYRKRAQNLKMFLSPLHKHVLNQVKFREIN